MIAIFLSILLFKSKEDDPSPSVQTINVHTYFDYSITMNNIDDQLIIKVPEDTFVFVSSLLGYEATIEYYNYTQIIQYDKKLVPDPKDRLIYFKTKGKINVKSTIDELTFNFHTLCLKQIKHKYEHIFISSDPNEYFYIKRKEGTYNSVGNTTFDKTTLLWYVGDDITHYELTTYIISYDSQYQKKRCYTVYKANQPEENSDKDIDFFRVLYRFSDIIYSWESKSALIFLDRVDVLNNYENNLFSIKCTALGNFDNQYSQYRAFFQTEFVKNSKTRILTRGENHYPRIEDLSLRLSHGINYLDFSIYNKIHIRSNGIFYIFPKISEAQKNINPYDQILGYYPCSDAIILNSGSDNYVAETDINVPVMYISLYDNSETYYIISSRPTQKLKIGSSEDADYTNDKNYFYLMVSLQNIKTKITFNGSVTAQKIMFKDTITISINSGDIIEGPFILEIKKDAECECETQLIGELKEGFVDDVFSFFKRPTKTSFISKRFVYSNATSTARDTSIEFKYAKTFLANLSNLVYVQTQRGWTGEIIYPVLDDNKIGPKYNRTSFYVGGMENNTILVMFSSENKTDNNFVLNYRSISTQQLGSEKLNCTRMIVSNVIPSKFAINSKPNDMYRRIDMESNEVVCMLPAFSNYFAGQSNYSAINVMNSTGYISDFRDHNMNEEYCIGIRQYNFYGTTETTMIILSYTEPTEKAKFAFPDMKSKVFPHRTYGFLPDEPKIYSEFIVNKEKGIHLFGENTYSPYEDGDDPIEIESSSEEDVSSSTNDNTEVESSSEDDQPPKVIDTELNSFNQAEMVNFKDIDTLNIDCPQSTLLFLQILRGLVAFIYEMVESESSYPQIIATLNEMSTNKLINFGKSRGRVVIQKDKTRSKVLNDDEQLLQYSFVNFKEIEQNSPENNVCDNVYIATNPKMHFAIKGEEYQTNKPEEFNYTLSNDKTLCLWFNFPIKTEIISEFNLPHKQMLYKDGTNQTITTSLHKEEGYNFFFILTKSNSSNNSEFAKYEANPVDESEYEKYENYEQINDFVDIENSNGIIGDDGDIDDEYTPNYETSNPTKDDNEKNNENEKKKAPIKTIIIVSVVAVVCIIVIIVVVIVVYRKKSKKIDDSERQSSLLSITEIS